MADKKISAMTAATSLVGTELIPIVQSGANKSTTPDQLKTNIPDYILLIAKDITAGIAQTYDLLLNAKFGFRIDSIELETDTGTLTGIVVKINSTPVTGLNGITATTLAEIVATADNTVVLGDRIYIETTTGYTGSPTTLKVQLNYKYT